MKKLLALFLNIYLVISSVFGQENVLYHEIQQAKEENTRFENFVLKRVNVETDEILRAFTNPDEVSFFENTSINSRKIETKAINLSIPYKTKEIVLELVEVPEYFYDYEILTSDWERIAPNKSIKHFRGVVKDDESSLVALTFYEDELMGMVATNEGNFNIAKNKQSGKHIFYNEQNLKEKIDWACDTEGDMSVTYDSEMLLMKRSDLHNAEVATRSTSINKIVKFYLETEFNIFQDRGSVAEVEAYVLGLMNLVGALYQNEEISTAVSFLHIWTSNTSYPYTGKNTSEDLLDQFQKTRTSIIGDLGMLLTFQNIGGRSAGYDGLCNSTTKNKLSVSGDLSSNFGIVDNYSRSVKVVTHEFGHTLGSYHTHDCKWTVGNTTNAAIDKCGQNAGYIGIGSCALGPTPSGGTMMSYCDHQYNNGVYNGNPGVFFNLGFGLQPGNVIRDKVRNANCLQTCDLTINNQTYNTGSHSILGCIVNISNSIVNPNTTVKIYGSESVILNSGFEVKSGANVMLSVGAQAHVTTN